ncbi:hypothetical protein AeMF1_004833 [Aphanomyces euteiches]|nr:hypothetical protein AeMF1_004833 [Aphanomyces euteiches]KAH9184411.1 hypothetical protein AeNC1_013612 [Aphanomyces euteiches]
MNFKQVETALYSTNMDKGVEICPASKADWERYVTSENQVLMSRAMLWRDRIVYIVELPACLHESLSCNINDAVRVATGTDKKHLKPRGSTYAESIDRTEPDSSFGPTRNVGVTPPSNLRWGEFHTLKIEIGVSRGWTLLDEKADHWATFPGVAYILCIRVTPNFEQREFKLHAVSQCVDTMRAPISRDNPILDITETTMVTMDSRRLLALAQDALIPHGFADPSVSFALLPQIRSAWYESSRVEDGDVVPL